MPRLAGMEGGAELDASDLLSEAQKEGVLGREPSALRLRADPWDVYTRSVSSDYWEQAHPGACVSPWSLRGSRIVRRLRYTVDTDVRFGPSRSDIVEVQELQHTPGALFERWSTVMPQASWGISFHIHVHIRASLDAEDGSVRIEHRMRPVVLRGVWGLQTMLHREAKRQCSNGFERWCNWVGESRDAEATITPD